VSPEATWASKQHRLRWVLPEIGAGDRGDLKAQFLPDSKSDPLASAGVLEGAAGLSSSPMGSRRCFTPLDVRTRQRMRRCRSIPPLRRGLERWFRLFPECTSSNRKCKDVNKVLQACPAAAAA